MIIKLIITIAFSYLLGSIPFSFILSKYFAGIDVRQAGTGNVGATNVLITTGKKRAAILSGILDLMKGFLAVALARIFLGADIYAYLAGIFAIIGHDFTIFLGFKGGKGVATTCGALMAINPFAIWFSVIVFLASLGISRQYILSNLIAMFVIPFSLFFLGEGVWGLFFGAACIVLSLYAHRKDILQMV